jgi:hypothetical protein
VTRPFSIKGTHGTYNRNRVVQSRSSYFDGKMPVMFMPGQASGLLSPNQLHDVPVRWPEAGQVCRVPKVVFLSVVVPPHLYFSKFSLVSRYSTMGLYGHHDVPEANPGGVAGAPGSQIFWHGGTYDLIDWLADPDLESNGLLGPRKYRIRAEVRNEVMLEYDRLIEACFAVKRDIESAYAGHVWVQVCQFLPSHPKRRRTSTILKENVFDLADEANKPLHSASGPLWMLGPDCRGGAHVDHFAGTDFLHIYMGMPAIGEGRTPPTSAGDVLYNYASGYRMAGHSLDMNYFSPTRTQVYCPPRGEGPWDDTNWSEFTAMTSGGIVYVDRYGNPVGKLSKLQEAHKCFAGYRTLLCPIGLRWSWPPEPSFANTSGATSRFPRGDLRYDDQDWVEAYHFQLTLDRMIEQGAQSDPDVYSPTWSGGTHPYNIFFREPNSKNYEYNPAQTDAENALKFNVRLAERFATLRYHMERIAPQTAAYFSKMIADHHLDRVGFEVGPTTSEISAATLTSLISDHFALSASPASRLPNQDHDPRFASASDDPNRLYPMSGRFPPSL